MIIRIDTAKVTKSERGKEQPNGRCELDSQSASESFVLRYLAQKHGPLVSAQDLQSILHFKTPAALERSLRRGNLGIPMRRMPHRRGLYARVEDVAAYLDALPQVHEDFEDSRPEESRDGERER